MAIKGFIPITLLDYPGKIASMIFLSGCNFRCHFCYNKELVFDEKSLPAIEEKEIFNYLEKKKNWLDGVVITGGEPTVDSSLITLCQKIKKQGLAIQIQTNGTNPEMLEKLIKNKLVDFVAMDLKGPLPKYHQIVNCQVDIFKIRESIELILKNPQIEAEFRTTIVPGLINQKDILEIIKMIKKTSRPYFIQQFQNEKTLDPKFRLQKPYESKELEKILKQAKKYYANVKLRGA